MCDGLCGVLELVAIWLREKMPAIAASHKA
jgi:hypothetical protein